MAIEAKLKLRAYERREEEERRQKEEAQQQAQEALKKIAELEEKLRDNIQ